MSTAEETREKRPELFERVDLVDRMPLYPSNLAKCPCVKSPHEILDYIGEPLRIYEWVILDRPIWNENQKVIIFAFIYKGKNHWALMNYNEETHQLLESFKEKFRQGFGVLLTPYWNRTPKGLKLLLKPAV